MVLVESSDCCILQTRRQYLLRYPEQENVVPREIPSRSLLVGAPSWWQPEVGKKRNYPLKSDAEAYERGWAEGVDFEHRSFDVQSKASLRSAYLEGVWDRQDAEQQPEEA
jgi:hypothetical protein